MPEEKLCTNDRFGLEVNIWRNPYPASLLLRPKEFPGECDECGHEAAIEIPIDAIDDFIILLQAWKQAV